MRSSRLGRLFQIVLYFPKQHYPGQDGHKDFWRLIEIFDCPQQLVGSVALTDSKQTFCCWTLEIFLFFQHHWEGGRKLQAPDWSSQRVYEISGLQDMSEMSRTVNVVSIAFRNVRDLCLWSALASQLVPLEGPEYCSQWQRHLPYEREGKVILVDIE